MVGRAVSTTSVAFEPLTSGSCWPEAGFGSSASVGTSITPYLFFPRRFIEWM
jgi:hypothetical protein